MLQFGGVGIQLCDCDGDASKYLRKERNIPTIQAFVEFTLVIKQERLR